MQKLWKAGKLSTLLLAGVAMTVAVEAKPAAKAEAMPLMLQEWTGPYDGVPPWDKVKPADFPAAFEAAMKQSKAEFEAILNNRAAITFDNTIKATELSGE